MTYIYRNGKEYLIKYKVERNNEIAVARPRKFGQLANNKRKDKHTD